MKKKKRWKKDGDEWMDGWLTRCAMYRWWIRTWSIDNVDAVLEWNTFSKLRDSSYVVIA